MLDRFLRFASLVVMLSGCGASYVAVRPVQETDQGGSHVTERNYTLGRSKSSYVGDSMVRLIDYIVNETSLPMMTADKNFNHQGSSVNGMGLQVEFNGIAGKKYPIVGETEVDGRTVYILDVPDSSSKGSSCIFCLMVDKQTSRVANKVIYSGNIIQPGTLTTTPADTTFSITAMKSATGVRLNAPYVNQEIIYGGMSNNTIRLTYREYDRNDLARVAFFQDLTYDANEKILRFRNIRMSVQHANNEEIAFTVLEDGIPK